MPLLLESHRIDLLANGRRRILDDAFDPCPVVRLVTPDAAGTWLLAELDPNDPDVAFGLCDLGLGFPELGEVRLSELEALRGRLKLAVECDRSFRACAALSAYATAARRAQRIVTDPRVVGAAAELG